MDFSGYVPPGIAIGLALIALLGGSWVVVGVWWLASHVSIGWH